jgi:hypothetical protein
MVCTGLWPPRQHVCAIGPRHGKADARLCIGRARTRASRGTRTRPPSLRTSCSWAGPSRPPGPRSICQGAQSRWSPWPVSARVRVCSVRARWDVGGLRVRGARSRQGVRKWRVYRRVWSGRSFLLNKPPLRSPARHASPARTWLSVQRPHSVSLRLRPRHSAPAVVLVVSSLRFNAPPTAPPPQKKTKTRRECVAGPACCHGWPPCC